MPSARREKYLLLKSRSIQSVVSTLEREQLCMPPLFDDPATVNVEEGAGLGIMKRFDYGLNGTVGIEVSKLVLSANYGWGLAKLQSGSGSGDDDNNKHRVLSFSLGFKL